MAEPHDDAARMRRSLDARIRAYAAGRTPSIPTVSHAELNGLLAGFSVERVPDAEELAATWVAFWGPVLESPNKMTRWDPTSRRWR